MQRVNGKQIDMWPLLKRAEIYRQKANEMNEDIETNKENEKESKAFGSPWQTDRQKKIGMLEKKKKKIRHQGIFQVLDYFT